MWEGSRTKKREAAASAESCLKKVEARAKMW